MGNANQEMSIADAIQIAVQHHRAGRLPEAEALYQRVLQTEPNNPEALHLLGMLARQAGKSGIAIDLISQAIRVNPDNPVYYNNLGTIYPALNRLDDAVACFRKALALKPDYSDAYSNLAITLQDQGKLDEAVACYQKALALAPDLVRAHKNLGAIFYHQGKLDEAVAGYRKAIALTPGDAETHNHLGMALEDQGRLDESMDCYRAAVTLKPDYAEAHINLGNVLRSQGKPDAAVACYRKAVELNPDHAGAHYNLGDTFFEQGKLDQAVQSSQRAIALNPDFADAHNILGNAFNRQGRMEEAAACYRKAIALNPHFAEAHNNLGNTMDPGRQAEAIACYRTALELKPDFVEAYSNLGNALGGRGRQREALACFRKALKLKPDFVGIWSNLLLALQYDPTCSPLELFEEHRRFAERFEVPLESSRQAFGNTREPERRLKVGYVSADFRSHSVAHFIAPVLANHDKSQVEVFCYYNHSARDEVTERLGTHADHWIACAGMTDDQLAARIRADAIDILVDLAGHTGANRLLVFARKPAPVQVTWLGYPSTTGLSAIDYRITDKYAEPEGMTDHLNVEKLWRLDDMFCVYRPCAVKPERRHSAELAVRQTPALENGHITFGSINNIAKITPAVVATWARILHAVPRARLLLEARGFDSEDMRSDFEARFAAHGIMRERLLLLERKPEQQYVLYHRIDIALDPFPCNGGTTTCDALWMGVPVIALAGTAFAARMGVTMVNNIGHPEWVARDEDGYVRLACGLAADAARLNAIRLGLREEVENSPLRDEAGFTRSLEAAYRAMWQAWC